MSTLATEPAAAQSAQSVRPYEELVDTRHPVHAAIDAIEKAAAVLAENLSILDDRLAPVMSPHMIREGMAARTDEPPSNSPLTERLMTLAAHVDRSGIKVRDITASLEV